MFNDYKNILYPFTLKNGKIIFKSIKDISTNIKIRNDVINNIQLYEYYLLRDGDTPEIISAKYYGDSKLHYLILLANNTFDWKNDYPLNQSEFDEYMKDSYTNINGIHHYEDLNGNIVPESNGEEIIPITNYEYEYKLNENKRRIKLINKKYINSIIELISELG